MASSDLFDALAIFEAFAVRELRASGASDHFHAAYKQVGKLAETLTSQGFLAAEMKVLSLHTYADRVRYGFLLLNREYKDP